MQASRGPLTPSKRMNRFYLLDEENDPKAQSHSVHHTTWTAAQLYATTRSSQARIPICSNTNCYRSPSSSPVRSQSLRSISEQSLGTGSTLVVHTSGERVALDWRVLRELTWYWSSNMLPKASPS
ncbi:hypothetical protein PM082_002206 [Marasmius tenuissimus]|nr:hypothetical protein PM082_002206 [Marasmius tenuissimus]